MANREEAENHSHVTKEQDHGLAERVHDEPKSASDDRKRLSSLNPLLLRLFFHRIALHSKAHVSLSTGLVSLTVKM